MLLGDETDGGMTAGDVRLGDVKLGDKVLGDVRLGDVRLGDVRLGDVRLGDVRDWDVRLGISDVVDEFLVGNVTLICVMDNCSLVYKFEGITVEESTLLL